MQTACCKISSSSAENALRSLANEQRRHCQENKVAIMDLNLLEYPFQSSDIFPMVKTNLVRNKDKRNSARVELAKIIGGSMQTFLSETFTGSEDESDFVLQVNISVVSDGSSSSKDKISSLLGRGKAQGYGLAKFSVAYCLFSRVSGNVVVAKRLTRWEEYCRGQRRRKLAVLDLATDLHKKLSREIKFICSGVFVPEKRSKSSKRAAVVAGSTIQKTWDSTFSRSKQGIPKKIVLVTAPATTNNTHLRPIGRTENSYSSCSSTSDCDDDDFSTSSFFEEGA